MPSIRLLIESLTAGVDRQPPLSAEQVSYGAIWRRSVAAPLQELEPEDIIQHIVSDCSVCASMVIATDHCKRFGSKVRAAARAQTMACSLQAQMILSSLFPQDADGHPSNSSGGRYQFRILYNGAYRRVRLSARLGLVLNS